MKLAIHHRTPHIKTYRVARAMSLFNSPSGAEFDLDVDLPLEAQPWKLGLIVGPSGSGKTSIGELVLGDGAMYEAKDWPADRPIIDAIAPDGDFDTVTGALSAVGLGTVPSWLRPYPVLSNGERFRADLARIVAEAPERVVIDEFTSVVDRQIARIGALAFGKAWKRGDGQAVLLSCHHDIIEWLQPDWTYDTGTHEFTWGCLQPRPRIELEIRETDWSYWPMFEPHHYLKVSRMPFSKCFVGFVDDEPVAHMAMSSMSGPRGAVPRACRLVIMPEWQGAGVGMRFLNFVCQRYLDGKGHLPQAGQALFHTSHPGLCAALRRDAKWMQVSAKLHGTNKRKSAVTIERSRATTNFGYGGHFRAVQGFKFIGAA